MANIFVTKFLDICNYNFLCATYAADSKFFLKDELSVIETMKVFDKFSFFSGLKSSLLVVKM